MCCPYSGVAEWSGIYFLTSLDTFVPQKLSFLFKKLDTCVSLLDLKYEKTLGINSSSPEIPVDGVQDGKWILKDVLTLDTWPRTRGY